MTAIQVNNINDILLSVNNKPDNYSKRYYNNTMRQGDVKLRYIAMLK
jgi:hypothetical protein